MRSPDPRTAQELYDEMVALYPNRINPGRGAVEFGARGQGLIGAKARDPNPSDEELRDGARSLLC